MAQEIYHRSDWGYASNEWGRVYVNAELSNELYKRAANYENSWDSDKMLDAINKKASIVLLPTAYEEDTIHNVKPSSAPFGDMTLTQSGTTTRIDENGLLVTNAVNIPRIDYSKGSGAILSELESTNQIRYSEDFSNVLWQKVGVTLTSSTGTNPRGESATIYAIQGAAAQGGLEGAMASTASGNGVGVSIWARKKSGVGTTNVEIGFGDSSTVTTTTVSVGSAWQRITYTSTGYTSANRFYIDAEGTSADNTIEVWGSQVEKSASGVNGKVSSYVPTTSGSVTRVKDEYFNGGDTTLIGATEGVFFIELAALNNVGTRAIALSASNSVANRVVFYFFNNNSVQARVQASSAQTMLNASVTDQTAFNKVAIKYKSGDIAFWINGTEVATSTASFTFNAALSELAFDQGTGANNTDAFVKQLAVFKEILSDAELAALTS